MRKRISGTPQRPRLNVYRSLKNFYVQFIDDSSNKVLLAVSTLDKDFKKSTPSGGNIKAAAALAEHVAKKAKEKNIKSVVFDRGGYLYFGRVKALAENLRKQGLEF
jgi:large subunit ribosomal protein L18